MFSTSRPSEHHHRWILGRHAHPRCLRGGQARRTSRPLWNRVLSFARSLELTSTFASFYSTRLFSTILRPRPVESRRSPLSSRRQVSRVEHPPSFQLSSLTHPPLSSSLPLSGQQIIALLETDQAVCVEKFTDYAQLGTSIRLRVRVSSSLPASPSLTFLASCSGPLL